VPLVGLTGGMGAGKSTALHLLAELGAAVLSSDAVVHELYGDSRVRDAVVERWGPGVAPDGVVDRAAVAERAFSGPRDREWLERLLWPLVGERMAQWVADVRACARGADGQAQAGEQAGVARQARTDAPARGDAPRAAVVEVPLLFEAGMEGAFDATIAVVAQEGLRRERAQGRSHALADERLARQLSQEEKAQRATFVVRNDGSVRDMRRELAAILAKLSG
jgi:dephospho-CoA kinase